MSPRHMQYEPTWYHVGDADKKVFAVLYGVLAIATVWVFESIVHLLLFSSNLHISLSEAAALVTFKGASCPASLRWAVSSRRGAKRCRRAYFAFLLRILVTLVDIAIVVLAVPQDINISEDHVGSTQLNLLASSTGNKLLPNLKSSVLESNPCIWDKTMFRKFTPNVAILICVSASDKAEPVSNNKLSSLGVVASYNRSRERLVFTAKPQGPSLFLTHNLFVPARDTKSATTFSLQLRSDIAKQAVDALNADSAFRAACQVHIGTVADFKCRNSSNHAALALSIVLSSIYTMRIEAPGRKVLSDGKEVNTILQVGNVNRPTLCVYPAVIVLVVLILLEILLKRRLGGDNLILKLYYLAAEAAGTEPDRNPFFAADRQLINSKTERNDAGSLGGYLHNTNIANART